MSVSEDALHAELSARGSRLRPAQVVMQPAMMGASRLTRYSFSRTMLRRAARDGRKARRVRFDIDDRGHGEAVYQIDARDCRLSFVAFTTTIDESEHTDQVIADRWEITGALVEGEPTDDFGATLRREVPRQEKGRFDSRVLVLTRGNRSVRFFDYLTDVLARGERLPFDALYRWAERGGVIGCTLYPLFKGGAGVSRREYCAMIARLASQVGVDHVAIGTDAVLGWQPDGLGWMRSGHWDRPPDADAIPDFPEWPAWFRGPGDFASLAAGIDEAGISPAERDAVLGGNTRNVGDASLCFEPPVPLAAIAGTLQQSLERGVASVGAYADARGDTTVDAVELRMIDDVGGAFHASATAATMFW